MSLIHCRFVTPEGLYKEFDTEILNIETVDGQEGILPEHMPVVAMLKVGKMSTIEQAQRNYYALSGGMLYFHRNMAEILTDAIENRDEIDLTRAQSAYERAQKRI